MLLQSKIFTLSPADIDANGPCVLWPRSPEPALVDSICRAGQLEPLLVRHVEGRVELVSGYSRLLALRELGLDAACLEVHVSEVDGAVLYLRANCAAMRDDSMRLKALRFFDSRIVRGGEFSRERLETDVLPLLDTDVCAKSWNWWQQWLGLPPDFDDLLHKGHLPLAAASGLAAFSPEERTVLLPCLRAVCWSRSNACHLLTWLYEATRLHEKSLVQMLPEVDFFSVLANGLSPKDMAAALLLEAKKLRYPHLLNMQDDLRKQLAPLVKGALWQVEHEDNFETPSLSVRCKIKNRNEAKRACQEFERITRYWETKSE